MQWFAFDHDELQDLARQRAGEYRNAAPFPHIVLDGVVPDGVLRRLLDEYPEPTSKWRSFADPRQHKQGATAAEADLGPTTRNVLAEFNSAPFIDFVQKLAGIEEGLVPDPWFKGGGLHQISTGGYLKVHADFNLHPVTKLDRRVNVLLYLNESWDTAWGGQLELWNSSMTKAVAKIEPVFNRMVIFSITDTAFHGHPDPLVCPPERARRSLAFYYYSNGRPAEERSAAHSTLFQARAEHSDELAPGDG